MLKSLATAVSQGFYVGALSLLCVSSFAFATETETASALPEVLHDEPVSTAGAKSRYSSLADKDCNEVVPGPLGKKAVVSANMDYADVWEVRSWCGGIDGFGVRFEGRDGRSWVGIIDRGRSFNEGFSYEAQLMKAMGARYANIHGTRVEWRMHDGRLAALLVRMSAEHPKVKNQTTENIVVLRVDPANLAKACVIGVVDAKIPAEALGNGVAKNLDAATAARAIADDLSRACL